MANVDLLRQVASPDCGIPVCVTGMVLRFGSTMPASAAALTRCCIDFDDDFWNLTLWVNLTVPYLLTKVALPGMLERQYGRIVNVASIAGKVGTITAPHTRRVSTACLASHDPWRWKSPGRYYRQCHLTRTGAQPDECNDAHAWGRHSQSRGRRYRSAPAEGRGRRRSCRDRWSGQAHSMGCRCRSTHC